MRLLLKRVDYFFEEIKGIKDRRLSSSPIQAANQEGVKMEGKVPKDKVQKNKICEEERKI